MADIFSKEKRSQVMSKIHGKDTQIETIVRSFLHANNIRFRKHVKDLPGKPDVSIKKYKIAIFINGCFWHGHENCKLAVTPSTNQAFWVDKIEKNKARDKRNIEKLEKTGWHVKTVWECEIKNDFESTMNTLLTWIHNIMTIEKRHESNG